MCKISIQHINENMEVNNTNGVHWKLTGVIMLIVSSFVAPEFMVMTISNADRGNTQIWQNHNPSFLNVIMEKVRCSVRMVQY